MKVHFGSQSLLKKSTVLFILFLVLLNPCLSIRGEGIFAETTTTYSILVMLENADDDEYTQLDVKTILEADAGAALPDAKLAEIVAAAKKAVIEKTTGVAEPDDDIDMSGTGFHLRGEGEQIKGYAPNESTISTYSEEGQSAFEYGYFDDDDNGKIKPPDDDADDDKIRGDGKTVISIFFNRDRYGVYLRSTQRWDCRSTSCPFADDGNNWNPDSNRIINLSPEIELPADPFIVKNGASLYKRFFEDEYTGSNIFKKLKQDGYYYWGCWARWARIPNQGLIDNYQVDLYNTPQSPRRNAYDVMDGSSYGLADGADGFTSDDGYNLHNVLRIEPIEYAQPQNITYQYYEGENEYTENVVQYGRNYEGYYNDDYSKEIWLNKPINGYIIEKRGDVDPVEQYGSSYPAKYDFDQTAPAKVRFWIGGENNKTGSYNYNDFYYPMIIRQYLKKYQVTYYPGLTYYEEPYGDPVDVSYGGSVSGTEPKKNGNIIYYEGKGEVVGSNIYIFKGWYEDEYFIQKADLTENRKMPDYDLKFYGKWEEIPTTSFSFTKVWAGNEGYTYLPKNPDQMMEGLILLARPEGGEEVDFSGDEIKTIRKDSTDEEGKKIWTYTVDPNQKSKYIEFIKNTVITVKELQKDGNQWSVKFSNLPASLYGKKITYKVKESIEGYFTYVDPELNREVADNGETIINFLNKMSISGIKTWDPKDNPNPPDEITIHLHKFGSDKEFATAKAAKNKGWKYEFKDLPVYENRKEIQYTVHEVPVDNYTLTEPEDGEHIIRPGGGSGYDFKNKYTPGKKDIIVVKEWNDQKDRDGLRPEEISVTLVVRNAQGQWDKYQDDHNTNPAELTKEGGWTVWFKQVPADREYNIYESLPDDSPYDLEKITNTEGTSFTIFNKYTPQNVTLTIAKTWNDKGPDDPNRPNPEKFLKDLILKETYKNETGEEVTVEYYNKLSELTPEEPEQPGIYKFLASARAGEINFEITVNAEDDPNAWKITVAGLPEYVKGKKITWKLEEYVANYEPVITASGTSFQAANTLALTDVTVTKNWVDEDDSKRPSEVEFLHWMWLTSGDWTLEANELEGGEQPDGTFFYRSSTYPTITVLLEKPKDDQWKVTIAGLPTKLEGVEMNYELHENPKYGYKASISGDQESGFTITNTLQREKIDIEVVKFWNDSGYDNVEHPEFTLRLYANDVEIQNTKIPAGTKETWKWQISGLDKYDESGKEIIYSISEDPVEHYQSVIDENTMEITNVFIPEQTEVHVEKRWNGENYPESVVVRLLADGEEVRTAELSSATNGWKYTFKSLPVYSRTDPTRRIEYTIEELSVPGWETSISGNAASGFVITNDPENIPPTPPRPTFFLLDLELPLTGITGLTNTDMKASVKYTPVDMELQIPMLDVTSKIVSVEPDADGVYPVTWLGMDAGLLSGTSLPGEGISVIAAHNTLNAEDYGPFALIATLAEGDRFFIRQSDGSMLIYEVYANEKIGASDVDELYQTASLYGSTVTLLTCEDERPEGGYASRRIVSAREVRF